MSQQTETNPTHYVEVHNHEVYDRRQISFRIGHFGSRQALEFSCFWCASYLAAKNKPITKCPNCNNTNNNKIKWLPVSITINNISRLAYGPKEVNFFEYYTNRRS